MKGLLHSKKFRRNLYKWLFMYVGCIALLTTVVTYSKYMSTFQSSDTARVAKFNVEVKSNEICDDINTEYCNKETYRTTSYIDYYFTVDTTELEVKTQLYLTLYIHNNFDIFGDIIEIDGDKSRNVIVDKDPSFVKDNYKYITIKNDPLNIIEPASGSRKIYKVRIKYNGTNYTEFNGTSQSDIIKVVYSAVQITN